jgi:hypothetical protein
MAARQDAKPAVRYLEGGRWMVQGELVRRALAALIRSDPVSCAALYANQCPMCRSLHQHQSRNIDV